MDSILRFSPLLIDSAIIRIGFSDAFINSIFRLLASLLNSFAIHFISGLSVFSISILSFSNPRSFLVLVL